MLTAVTKEPIRSGEAKSPIPPNEDPQAIGTGHLWDTKEVAAFLNVKESTIRNWVHIGYIPHIKFRGAVRFNSAAIASWVEGCAVSVDVRDPHKISGAILRPRFSRS